MTTRLALVGSVALVLTCASNVLGQSGTGAYVGANVGFGTGQVDAETEAASGGDYFAADSLTAIAETGMQELKPSGLVGGGQVGFNVQIGAAVFGVEADFGVMRISETANETTEYPCCAPTGFTIEQSVETSWLATVRPRLGFAAGPVFIFGTGGVAITEVTYATTFNDTFAAAHADSRIREQRMGATYGGGLEFRRGRASFKLEYLYADLGSVSMTSDNFTEGNPPVIFEHDAKVTVQVVRAGVNVRF